MAQTSQTPGDGLVPADESVERFGYQQELSRSLSFRDLLVYGLVSMVRIAPFGIFGAVYRLGRDGGARVRDRHGGDGLHGVSYSEMARAFPVAGSAAQTLGLLWLGLGALVLVFLYATGRRPELAGMGGDSRG